MTENHPGDSGSANMPPFPPIRPGNDPSRKEERPPEADDTQAYSESGAARADDAVPRQRARGAGSFANRASARVRHRTQRSLHRGFENIADRLEETAERIERLVGDRFQGSPGREKAGDAAQAAAGWLDDAADYLRNADPDKFQRDLEGQVRENPLRTLLIAVAAGWTLGKIVR